MIVLSADCPMMMRVAALAALLASLPAAAIAQPCNPVVDGFYCESQGVRGSDAARRGVSMTPIESLGQGLGSLPRDDVATFGAIQFRHGGTKCIGLLRRGKCE
jgi:hypothetical protein